MPNDRTGDGRKQGNGHSPGGRRRARYAAQLTPRLEKEPRCVCSKKLRRASDSGDKLPRNGGISCQNLAVRYQLKLAVLLPFATGLAVACAQGSGEREDPFRYSEPVDAPEPEPEAPVEVIEAEQYGPTSDPVPELAEEFDFDCEGTPGSRVAQRLNRLEYDNTVRDLLGIDDQPASAFPKDDFGDSFDNNARALTISPVLTESYAAAAESIAAAAMDPEGETYERLMTCSPKSAGAENCAKEILSSFLARAFRRPVNGEELQRYVDIVTLARDEGGDFDEGIQAAIEAALMSVNFIFRMELDEEPEDDDFHVLTQYEIASRLSYFLWASMPDEELLDAAKNDELSSEEQILEQVDRMLGDPKADAMLVSFVSRWLETADIAQINQPAEDMFPEFTSELQEAMQLETQMVMRDVLRGELPFSELLTTDATYVNATLAEFYGIEGDFGAKMKKASLKGTARRGLLTHGSLLTLTSAPTRTSPVRRGVYVLTNLLCAPPPPPPPEVQGDLGASSDEIPDDLPLAAKAKLHSENPACAGCHSIMDPIGFGLEQFDAIGRFRTEENEQEIDASGELLVDGEFVAFEGAAELAELLSEDERLSACAMRKLYTYALGRLVDTSSKADACRLDWLRERFEAADFDFKEAIRMMALTDSFRGRHGGLSSSQTSQEND